MIALALIASITLLVSHFQLRLRVGQLERDTASLEEQLLGVKSYIRATKNGSTP